MEEEIKEVVEEKPDFEKKLDIMRAENERMEKNISELKNLKAINALSGNIDAGSKPEPEKKETPAEYLARITGHG